MKILLLNHFIQNFTGSEVNAIQLCEALQSLGHEAHIGTLIYKPPLKDYISHKNLRVINLLDEQDELVYDLVWAHHAPVLAYLLFKKNIANTRILFNSLSPILPLESPPIFIEDIHYYLSLSPTNSQVLVKNGVPEDRIQYFPNYAPAKYFDLAKNEYPVAPERIAVVSNHPPQEIRDFARLARENQIQVDFIGVEDNHVFVDDQLLLPYDLTITIGKTVQYCFALKIPVYCYDHFGGVGYINPQNYAHNQANNFSGRLSGIQRDAKELLVDILSNYQINLQNLDFLYQECQTNYCLETNLKKVLQKIASIPITDIQAFREKNTLGERVYDTYLGLLNDIFSLQHIILAKNQEINHVASSMEIEQEAILSAKDVEIQKIIASYENTLWWKIAHPSLFFKRSEAAKLLKRGRNVLHRTINSSQDKKDYALIKDSVLFDETWYLRQYPDVASKRVDPAWHYLLHGGFEGRDPGPEFSTNQYIHAHPEIITTRINPLLHYLKTERGNK